MACMLHEAAVEPHDLKIEDPKLKAVEDVLRVKGKDVKLKAETFRMKEQFLCP